MSQNSPAHNAFGHAAESQAYDADPHAWTPDSWEKLAADLATSHPAYRITGFHQQGGMGAVYRAQATDQHDNPLDLAIKTLRPDALHDEKYLARFEREISLLQKIQHPGIISVFDHGVTAAGVPFFVMPFVAGETLQQVLTGPRLSQSRVLGIMEQLCAAIAYAHQAKIIHRDLKPANIFLTTTPDGQDAVTILDFGVARDRGNLDATRTSPGNSPGTIGYIAPEVMKGQSASYPADIYALGIICHDLLTGAEPAVSFDPNLESVVSRAMHQFPAKRYQTAEEFAQALGRPAVTVDIGFPNSELTSEEIAIFFDDRGLKINGMDLTDLNRIEDWISILGSYNRCIEGFSNYGGSNLLYTWNEMGLAVIMFEGQLSDLLVTNPQNSEAQTLPLGLSPFRGSLSHFTNGNFGFVTNYAEGAYLNSRGQSSVDDPFRNFYPYLDDNFDSDSLAEEKFETELLKEYHELNHPVNTLCVHSYWKHLNSSNDQSEMPILLAFRPFLSKMRRIDRALSTTPEHARLDVETRYSAKRFSNGGKISPRIKIISETDSFENSEVKNSILDLFSEREGRNSRVFGPNGKHRGGVVLTDEEVILKHRSGKTQKIPLSDRPRISDVHFDRPESGRWSLVVRSVSGWLILLLFFSLVPMDLVMKLSSHKSETSFELWEARWDSAFMVVIAVWLIAAIWSSLINRRYVWRIIFETTEKDYLLIVNSFYAEGIAEHPFSHVSSDDGVGCVFLKGQSWKIDADVQRTWFDKFLGSKKQSKAIYPWLEFGYLALFNQKLKKLVNDPLANRSHRQ